MSQSERIFYLDRKLRMAGRVTAAQVAEYFEVSVRQVKRDIEYLRDRFGAPIVWSAQEKAYHYEHSYDELAFADQKLVLSYVIMKSLCENEHYIPVYSDELIKTIANDVPADYRSICDKISYQIPHGEHINPEFFIGICDSIREKCCLEIQYLNLKGETSLRLVECERIINYGGTWYILCWDQLRASIRTFHVSRIQSVRLSHTPFTKHSILYEEELENHATKSFGIFKGQKAQIVKVRFYNAAARIIATQNWHPSQQMMIAQDATPPYIELEFPAADFTEVLAKLLSFGADAHPIEPAQLVTLWKAEINKMVEASLKP